MHILLASATPFEVAPFRAYFEANPGEFPGLEISFLVTGVGLVATAISVTKALSGGGGGGGTGPGPRTGPAFAPELAIQAGIAGTFDNNLPLGGVYTITSDLVADLGVEEDGTWKDVFDLKLADPYGFPFTGGRLMAPRVSGVVGERPADAAGSGELPSAQALFGELPAVPAISVNTITTRPGRIAQIITKYAPVLESMEGAAFHQVVLENRVPFVQLRAVSNYIGERNKQHWKMKEAIANLNEVLKEGLRSFASQNK